jgi:TonB-linked SusC/RagA family outer membrane protein
MKNKHLIGKGAYIRFLCFSVLIFGTAVSSFAQVTLNVQNKPIRQIIKVIEKNTQYRFLYSDDFAALNKTASLNVRNVTIDAALKALFDKNGISWNQKDNNLIELAPANSVETQVAGSPHSVSGKVTDISNQPVPGASVMIKGTSTGTITDSNGNYTFNNLRGTTTLKFSFVGMKTQEIQVANQTRINVVLADESIGLQEVVAVGYGTQKKINLTGSVSSVSAQDFANRPSTNITNALEGKMPGVTITTTNGQPGRDGGTITVRGIGTGLGGSPASSGPMVIVDGIVASMGEVNQNDIETISVLKDAASAAIYGARASNGVILITTKKGQKGHLQFTYNVYGGLQSITSKPDFLPSWQQASLYNQALTNEGSKAKWTDADIQSFKDGTDFLHPNTDWLSLFYSRPGYQQSHTFSVNGGDDKSQYMFSIGYFDQQGNVAKTDYKKYNARFNLNSQLNKFIGANAGLSFLYAPFTEPVSTYATSFSQIIRQINRISNTVPYIYPNGAYGYVADGSPMAWLNSASLNQSQNYTITGNFGLDLSPVKDLHVKPSLGYRLTMNQGQQYVSDIQYYSGGSEGTALTPTKYQGPNNLTNSSDKNAYTILQVLANYEKNIAQHHIKILGGASQEYSRYNYMSAYRQGFLNNAIDQINAAPADGQKATGYANEWTLQSIFGRVNYDYAEKYLIEANVRSDGSSRFASGKRWGTFPSVSLGWVVSKENFFKQFSNIVNVFKVRASWGKLGNQQISNYPTVPVISPGQVYSFNQNLVSGLAPKSGANPNIQWEATETKGLGIDAAFLNNRLNLSADYFVKNTSNILMVLPIASPYALSAPYQNAGAMSNKGIEINVGYKQKLGDFTFDLSGNVAYIKNTVTDLKGTGPVISGDTFYDVNYPFRSLYGFKCLGIYQNTDDLTKYPAKLNSKVGLGDLIYKDQNGDGKIDSNDKVFLGTYYPKYNFGFTANGSWKDLSLTLFFQGVAGVKTDGAGLIGLVGPDVQKPTSVFLDAWTSTNHSTTFPRLWYRYTQNDPSVNPSSFWMKNSSYLRLKNVTLSYNLPKTWVSKVGLTSAKIFYSGQNVLTFTKFYKWIDPEVGATGSLYSYPQVMVNSIGLNVTF